MNQNIGLNALKVLMILFVIFIHENPTLEENGEVVMWWHSIVVVAVPVFFTLSGYFFFRGMEVMTLKVYKKKLVRRLRTLLFPYLIWNCMPILFVIAGNLYSIIFRGKSTNEMYSFLHGLWNDGIWHIWWDKTSGGMPFDSPLWYVRDLMILCILTPLFYIFIQKIGWLYTIIIGILYLAPISLPVGFSSIGLFFFGLGSTIAIKGITIDTVRGKILIYGLAICFYYLSNTFGGDMLHGIFIMSSCYAWILLFYQLNGPVIKRIATFSGTVFFVLALHNIIVLANIWKVLDLILVGSFHVIIYWIAPLITLAICILLYFIFKKMMPQTMSFLCGGR